MSRPIRVLYVSSVSLIGGAEHSLIELASHLDHSQIMPYLLTSAEGPLAQRFRNMGIDVQVGSFPVFSRRDPRQFLSAVLSILRMVMLIRRHKIDLIHVNCDQAVPHAVTAGRFANVACLCHIHDMMRVWFFPNYVRYLNQCDRIIADSEATARHCLAAGMDANKLQVIYECFEMERFANASPDDRIAVRSELGISLNAVAIGLVGGILRNKGHEDFLRAAAVVAREVPTTRFVIVGDDALSDDPKFLPSLHELAVELGIDSQVIFTGFRTDVPQIIAALDIVAVPSWSEAFGRIAVEALATQRPVVATNVGGIPEIVQDGYTGLLCPPKQPPVLAVALLKLCRDPSLREEMGRRGPSVAAHFDVHAHVEQFKRTYDSILIARRSKRQGDLLERPATTSHSTDQHTVKP